MVLKIDRKDLCDAKINIVDIVIHALDELKTYKSSKDKKKWSNQKPTFNFVSEEKGCNYLIRLIVSGGYYIYEEINGRIN